MKKMTSLGIVLSLMVLAWPVVAQEGPATISQSFTAVVTPGHEQQFEEALKQHMAWHRQQNDTWRWNTSVIVSGERLGQYITISGGHRWADFDSPPVSAEADMADAARLFEHVERIASGFGNTLPALSRPPASSEPMPLVQVFTYRVKPGQAPVFQHAVGKFREAAEKTNSPFRYVLIASISGGPVGTYILVVPHENWASFVPPEQDGLQMLEEALGRQEADAVIEMLNEAVASEVSEIWQYRPDLSYIPGPS